MTSSTRLKIAVACLFVMAVVAAGVLVLVSVVDTNPTDMGSIATVQKTAAVAATRPATNYSNAADAYREAATLTDAIYSDEWGRYEEGNFDKDAAAFFAKNSRVADLVRAGAASPSCDWGGSLIDGHVSLNALRTAASFTAARARFEQSKGDLAAAMEDLLAVAALGRRVGGDALMISKLVEDGMDAMTTQYLAAMLPALSKEQLLSLRTKLNELPKSVTGPEIMTAEFKKERDSARKKQSGVAHIAMVDSAEPFYRAMSDAWDKPQPEFAAAVDAKMEEFKLNTLAKQVGPTTVIIHEIFVVRQAKRAMLLTAIDILTRGEAAVQDSHDPLGKGPFGYVKTAKGFELTSEYKLQNQPAPLNSAPVKLTIGE